MTRKVIAVIMAALFAANYVLADAWAAIDAGKPPYENLGASSGAAANGELDVETFLIPAHMGEIKQFYKGTSGRTIIHIQDAHCNVYAQRKVSEIIDYLYKEYGVSVLNLEGGTGDYDLRVFTSITGEAIREEVAEYFVEKGEVNGAELFAIKNPGKAELWGVEDKDLYLANLKVYRDSLTYRDEVAKYLGQIGAALDALKKRIYTPELAKVDDTYNSYKSGKTGFREYLEYLILCARQYEVDINAFNNVTILSGAIDKESRIDFRRAGAERDYLIKELQAGLSKNEARELIGRTLDFKGAKLSRREFYGYLLKKAASLGLDIKKYSSLSMYVDYITAYETVDRGKVMKELDELEAAIKEKLYTNGDQRELNKLSHNLAIMNNVFNIALTKTDYRFYTDNADEFKAAKFLDFIKAHSRGFGLNPSLDDGIPKLDGYLREISRFYTFSFDRDKVFLKNMKFGRSPGGAESAVIVTGGFHTENLCDLFEKEKISYISILPKFTSEEGYDSPYFEILAGETVSIEKVLKSVIAQAAMMQIASHLSSLGEAVWGNSGQYAFKAAVYIQARTREGKRIEIVDKEGAEGKVLVADGRPLSFGEQGEIERLTIKKLLYIAAGYKGGDISPAGTKALLAETMQKFTAVTEEAIKEYSSPLFAMGDPEQQEALEKKLMPAYRDLMQQLLAVTDPAEDAEILYPFMGPDIIPAVFRKTVSVNWDKDDAERGLRIAERAFGERPDAGLNRNSKFDQLEQVHGDAADIKNYEFLAKRDRRPCIFLMKGWAGHGGERSEAALEYILKNLRTGDKIMVMEQTDLEMLRKKIGDIAALPQNLYDEKTALFLWDYGDNGKLRTLNMPHIAMVFEKKGDTFVGLDLVPSAEKSAPQAGSWFSGNEEMKKTRWYKAAISMGVPERLFSDWTGIAWLAESAAAFGIGYLAIYLGVGSIAAAITAGMVFWLPHLVGNRKAISSGTVIGLFLGTIGAMLLATACQSGFLAIGAVVAAHWAINKGILGRAPPAIPGSPAPAISKPAGEATRMAGEKLFSEKRQEMRELLIADRMGMTRAQFEAWKKTDPSKAEAINKRLKEMSEMDDYMGLYLKKVDSENVVIAKDDPAFSNVYEETEEIVKRLLRAAGLDPANFEVYLLDSTEPNAFVPRYDNKVFVNLGLIKYILENGGSKNAVAFVIAHEIRHIFQWVDDTIEGKPVERGIGALIGRHAGEYDADYALALLDSAGYSVRDAAFFFTKLLEKQKPGRGISLGFLTHPPTIQRLRKLERDIMRFFWLNFFKSVERYSDASKSEVEARSSRRMFQEMVAQSRTPDDFERCLDAAATPEEYVFAIMIAKQNNVDIDARAGHRNFVKKFNFISAGETEMYRIMFEIINIDLQGIARMAGIIIRDNSMGTASYSVNILKPRLSGKSIPELMDMFAVQMIKPISFDSYDMELKGVYNLNYSAFFASIAYAFGERVKSLYANGDIKDIDQFLKLIEVFRQRVMEFNAYSSTAMPADVGGALDTMIGTSLKVLNDWVMSGREVSGESISTILRFIDDFERNANYSQGEEAIRDLCRLMMNLSPRNKDIVAEWLEKDGGEKATKFRQYFFNYMARDPDLTRGLPGMGASAQADVDRLFDNSYFAKQAVFSRARMSDDPMMRRERNILVAVLGNLADKYSLSPQQKLDLYEHTMQRLKNLRIDEKLEGVYKDLYEEIKGLKEVDERIRQKMNLPEEMHPEVKMLLYFYGMGGVLSFDIIRREFFTMAIRAENEVGPPLKDNDVRSFYEALSSREKEIKVRYVQEDDRQKTLTWNKYVLPFALFLSYDKLSLSEDEVKFPYPEDDKKGRFGRFIGEFDGFSEYNAQHTDNYQKNSVARGRGVNRVSITAEGADKLFGIYAYVTSSDKDFDALFDEITKKLPATSYRNFALYTLFVAKFLVQECGADMDPGKAFDLVYMQGIIEGLEEGKRAKAYIALARLRPSMVEDEEMRRINQPGLNELFKKIDDQARRSIIAEHSSQSGNYYPMEYAELGGALSQLDIFTGLLGEKNLESMLSSDELSIRGKTDIVVEFFPRRSNTRDQFLVKLIEGNASRINSAGIEGVLSMFNSEALREKYAVLALEKKQGERPQDFRSLDGELKWLLHYFPELSPTRDDLLLDLINRRANTPPEMQNVRQYLLKAPENIRKKKQERVVFGSSMFDEYMARQEAAEKMKFLLWAFGITEEKPFFMVRFEYEYNVSLNGLRSMFVPGESGLYKGVGNTAREDFLERMFLGEKGIFYEETVSSQFLDTLFTALMPGEQSRMIRAIYDAVFKMGDPQRKYDIVTALLNNYSEERRASGEVRRARAIKIFLGSLGLIGKKLAQFLSTSNNVPEDVRSELKELRSRAKPLTKEVVFDMIAKIYGSFANSPIVYIYKWAGGASIKDVYKGRLKDGSDVVIKVKRPDVEKKVEEDLKFLQDILTDESVKGALRDEGVTIPKQLTARITEMIREEMSLSGEAEKQALLAENLKAAQPLWKKALNALFGMMISRSFRTPARKYMFAVPATYAVMNNTLMIEDAARGTELKEENTDAMIALARELMRQIFVDGFYHADPHTGNIFVDEATGTISFIDLGSAEKISMKNRYLLYRLMNALSGSNAAEILKVIKIIAKNETVPGLEQKSREIAASGNNAIAKVVEVFGFLEDSGVKVDPQLMSIFRCFAQGRSLFEMALRKDTTQAGSWLDPLKHPVYARKWAAGVESFLSLGLVYAAHFSMGAVFTPVISAALAAAIFWLPHAGRGTTVLKSSPIVSLAIGTAAAMYLATSTQFGFLALIALAAVHFAMNRSVPDRAPPAQAAASMLSTEDITRALQGAQPMPDMRGRLKSALDMYTPAFGQGFGSAMGALIDSMDISVSASTDQAYEALARTPDKKDFAYGAVARGNDGRIKVVLSRSFVEGLDGFAENWWLSDRQKNEYLLAFLLELVAKDAKRINLSKEAFTAMQDAVRDFFSDQTLKLSSDPALIGRVFAGTEKYVYFYSTDNYEGPVMMGILSKINLLKQKFRGHKNVEVRYGSGVDVLTEHLSRMDHIRAMRKEKALNTEDYNILYRLIDNDNAELLAQAMDALTVIKGTDYDKDKLERMVEKEGRAYSRWLTAKRAVLFVTGVVFFAQVLGIFLVPSLVLFGDTSFLIYGPSGGFLMALFGTAMNIEAFMPFYRGFKRDALVSGLASKDFQKYVDQRERGTVSRLHRELGISGYDAPYDNILTVDPSTLDIEGQTTIEKANDIAVKDLLDRLHVPETGVLKDMNEASQGIWRNIMKRREASGGLTQDDAIMLLQLLRKYITEDHLKKSELLDLRAALSKDALRRGARADKALAQWKDYYEKGAFPSVSGLSRQALDAAFSSNDMGAVAGILAPALDEESSARITEIDGKNAIILLRTAQARIDIIMDRVRRGVPFTGKSKKATQVRVQVWQRDPWVDLSSSREFYACCFLGGISDIDIFNFIRNKSIQMMDFYHPAASEEDAEGRMAGKSDEDREGGRKVRVMMAASYRVIDGERKPVLLVFDVEGRKSGIFGNEDTDNEFIKRQVEEYARANGFSAVAYNGNVFNAKPKSFVAYLRKQAEGNKEKSGLEKTRRLKLSLTTGKAELNLETFGYPETQIMRLIKTTLGMINWGGISGRMFGFLVDVSSRAPPVIPQVPETEAVPGKEAAIDIKDLRGEMGKRRFQAFMFAAKDIGELVVSGIKGGRAVTRDEVRDLLLAKRDVNKLNDEAFIKLPLDEFVLFLAEYANKKDPAIPVSSMEKPAGPARIETKLPEAPLRTGAPAAGAGMNEVPAIVQFEALKQLLQNKKTAEEMAKFQHDAYYKGLGQEPPVFIKPEQEGTPEAKNKIAQNLAGVYALECGMGVICERDNKSPLEVLKLIKDRKISEADMTLLGKFANATWKASQYFLGPDRLGKANFEPAALLTEDERRKDFDQIYAAADQFYSRLTEQVSKGMSPGEEQRLIAGIDSLVDSIMAKQKLTAQEEGALRQTALTVMYAHQDQRRRGGEPYFVHQLRVANNLIDIFGVTDPWVIEIALLHDTREDQEKFYGDFREYVRTGLGRMANVDMRALEEKRFDRMRLGVRILSHLDGEKYEKMYPDKGERDLEYLRRLADPRKAYPPKAGSGSWYNDDFILKMQLIKLSDKIANMGDLTGAVKAEGASAYDWVVKQFRKTAEDFIPVFVENSAQLRGNPAVKEKFYLALREALGQYLTGDEKVLRDNAARLIAAINSVAGGQKAPMGLGIAPLSGREMPSPEDIKIESRKSGAWNAKDVRGRDLWVKFGGAREAFAYKLAETMGVNVPPWEVVPVSSLDFSGHEEELAEDSVIAGEKVENVLVTRDIESLAQGELLQQGSSGLEEMLVFFAWAAAMDVSETKNTGTPDIGGMKRYLTYDLQIVPGTENEGYALPSRFLLKDWRTLDLSRLEAAIGKMDALDRETVYKIAVETKAQDPAGMADALMKRKAAVRKILADGLRDAAKDYEAAMMELPLTTDGYTEMRYRYNYVLQGMNEAAAAPSDKALVDKAVLAAENFWKNTLADVYRKDKGAALEKLMGMDEASLKKYALENNHFLAYNLSAAKSTADEAARYLETLKNTINGFETYAGIRGEVLPRINAAAEKAKETSARLGNMIALLDPAKGFNYREGEIYRRLTDMASAIEGKAPIGTPGVAALSPAATGMRKTNEPVGKYIEKQMLENKELGPNFDVTGRSMEERRNILNEMIARKVAFPRGEVVFIKIEGLAGEGQYAHIGFGRTYGSKVSYIDSKYAANETVIGHELEEFRLWEDALKTDPVLRTSGIKSLAEIRDWMKGIEPGLTNYMFDLARELHERANDVYDVSKIGLDGIDEFRVSAEAAAAAPSDAELVDRLILEAQGKGKGKPFNLESVILQTDEGWDRSRLPPKSLQDFFLDLNIKMFSERFDRIVRAARERVASENAGSNKAFIEREKRLASFMDGLTKGSLEKLPGNRDVESLKALKAALVEMFAKLSLSKGIRGVKDKEEQLVSLMEYVFERLIAQDEDDLKLPFTPHGAKHSLLVAEYMRDIVRNSDIIRQNMKKFYGNEYESIAFLLGLMHDIGYAGLEGAARDFGVEPGKMPKGYHADIGKEMVAASAGSKLVALFGMDRTGSRPDKTALDDFLDAILLHGADKKDVKEEGEKGSGKHKYTEASETNNPLLLLTRMADNIDITRERLRKWQMNPWFIRILHNMTEDMVLKGLLSDAERNKEAIQKRIEALRSEEIAKLKKRHELATAFRKGDFDALQKFAKQFGLDPNDPRVGTLLNQLLDKDFEAEFREIQKGVAKMDHESLGHFIGALAVRSISFMTINGKFVIKTELTPEAADPIWKAWGEFQIKGKGRTNFALQSLSIGSEVVQIRDEDIEYTKDGYKAGETAVYKGDTVAAAAFRNINMNTVVYMHDGVAETPLAAAAAAPESPGTMPREEVSKAAEAKREAEAQVEAAKKMIGDFRANVIDWIITPMNEEAASQTKSIDTAVSRKFRKDYGSDTIVRGYAYNGNDSDAILKNNLRMTFEKVITEMMDPKNFEKKPRAIAWVPDDKYNLALEVLAEITAGPQFEEKLKGASSEELKKFSERITIIREIDMPADGVIDEVMHVVGGKGLLNAERFRKNDYGEGVKLEGGARDRLIAFLRSLDPSLSETKDIIEKILDGSKALKIKPIDYKEIQEWKAAQDEVLRSL